MFQNDLQSKNPKKMEIIGKDWHYVQPKTGYKFIQLEIKKITFTLGNKI